MIHRITGAWYDAVSSMFAFCAGTQVAKAEVEEFKGTVVRLVSLCNAMMFAELEGKDLDIDSRSWQYSLIDAHGLDQGTLAIIARSKRKAEVTFQMLQILTTKGARARILAAPDPVVARVFADLSQIMLDFHEASKMHIPFPFAYSAVIELLLALQIVCTPMAVVNWVSSSAMAGLMTFSYICTMCTLNAIALEMDNPFQGASHDCDIEELQLDFNKRMLALFQVPDCHTPSLDAGAKSLRGTLGRKAAVSEILVDSSDTFALVHESVLSGRLDERNHIDSSKTDASFIQSLDIPIAAYYSCKKFFSHKTVREPVAQSREGRSSEGDGPVDEQRPLDRPRGGDQPEQSLICVDAELDPRTVYDL